MSFASPVIRLEIVDEMRSFLDLLRMTSKPQAKVLLKSINPNQLKALSEIALNVLEGTLSVQDLSKLSRNFVRSLADRRKSFSYKKRLLTKHLEFLLSLLNNVDLNTICKNLS